MKNKKNLFVVIALLAFVVLSVVIFFDLKHAKLNKKNYWKDGNNIGIELSIEEKAIFGNIKSKAENFKSDYLSKNYVKIFDEMIEKFNKTIQKNPGEYVNYRELYKSAEEKAILKIVFKWRKDFRNSKTKDELKILRKMLSKLTLEDKIKLTGGVLIA